MLELYYSETCPYCKKVISNFDNQKIIYKPMDVTLRENYERLLVLGHMSQVPFLYDTDKDVKMYESDKIIEYVEKNYRAA
jgi:glutathione S-transferase